MNERWKGCLPVKMKILGTAAAEGLPALFCQCDLCLEAKRRGGKNLRTRTSAMIGCKYKLDLPPDSYMHMITYGLDLGKLEYLLITHAHEDHFSMESLELYRKYNAYLINNTPLKMYLSETAYNLLIKNGFINELDKMNSMVINILSPYVKYETEDLYFTPVIVNHDKKEICYNYYIEIKNGKNIFYSLDSKNFPQDTINFLKGCCIDICIVDATHLYNPCDTHRDFHDVIDFYNFLTDNNILSTNAEFIVSHFSHNGNRDNVGGNLAMLHENLESIYSPLGIRVAYDGMELNLLED